MADSPITRAAGVLLTSPSGKSLFTRRVDEGHYWSIPGGVIEPGEEPDAAARRELLEETGFDYKGPLNQLSRRVKDGVDGKTVDFTTFGGEVSGEFKPHLNAEYDLHKWSEPKQAMADGALHPGLKTTLEMPHMNELDIAKAIRDDELASPVSIGNVMLANMRITGTGAAYRKALDEYVWRDPALYMTDEFVERCNGLPVILDHPVNGNLDSKEFAERAVGSIVLPYKDDAKQEVWGIAKIYDDAAKQLIADGKLSTSPAVVFTHDQGKKHEMGDGQHILIEGEPALLDHLALCELGVWDKGGPATGVESVQSIETTTTSDSLTEDTKMADEKAAAKKDASMPENSKEGEALDMILTHIDSLHKRMDALEAKDADEKEEEKKDAAEESKDDAEEEEEEKKDAAEEKKEDAAEEKEEKKDAKRKDGEDMKEDAKREDAKREDAKREDSRHDSVAALHKELAEIKGRLPVELAEDDRQQYVAVQVKADSVAQMFGKSAPRWQHGESLLQYRRRMARSFQEHSPAWKSVDISKINDSAALTNIESQIYADAVEAAKNPAPGGKGELRAVTTTDSAGRRITRFYGDNSITWAPFQPAVQRQIVGFYREPSVR